MLHHSVQAIYEQIREQHARGAYGTIEEGLPPGTQDSDIRQRQQGQPGQPGQQTRKMLQDPKQAMKGAADTLSDAVQQVAVAANMEDNMIRGQAPAPFKETQPRKPMQTPQEKARRGKVLNALGDDLDQNEDGQIDQEALQNIKGTAGRQVAEHMITDENFTKNLSQHLKGENKDPERVTMLFTEAVHRMRIEDYNKSLKAIQEHFSDAVGPVVEFTLDIIKGDLSAIVEGQTPEQISENLAKRLAGLGVASAVSLVAEAKKGDDIDTTKTNDEEDIDGYEERNDKNKKELEEAKKRRAKILKKGAPKEPDAPAGHTKDLEETTKTSCAVGNAVFTTEQRDELLDGIFG